MTNPPADDAFLARVRSIEERLFGDRLDPEDKTRITSGEYSWLYRPTHHVSSGLVTEADIDLLLQPGKRVLSVGAHPAYLEKILVELGIPKENMLVADKDDGIATASEIPSVRFDMLEEWPDIGMFDLILFPESICIALTDKIKEMGPFGDEKFAKDEVEAALLAALLSEALAHLLPGGEIRANGPQSHPNVVNKARKSMNEDKVSHELDYQRYFLKVRHVAR